MGLPQQSKSIGIINISLIGAFSNVFSPVKYCLYNFSLNSLITFVSLRITQQVCISVILLGCPDSDLSFSN